MPWGSRETWRRKETQRHPRGCSACDGSQAVLLLQPVPAQAAPSSREGKKKNQSLNKSRDFWRCPCRAPATSGDRRWQ